MILVSSLVLVKAIAFPSVERVNNDQQLPSVGMQPYLGFDCFATLAATLVDNARTSLA
jgi:hypothetical protein